MNASNRILFALALSLAASTPAIAAADGALTLRCDAPAPSIHDVAQAFGIDAVGHVGQACWRGGRYLNPPALRCGDGGR